MQFKELPQDEEIVYQVRSYLEKADYGTHQRTSHREKREKPAPIYHLQHKNSYRLMNTSYSKIV